MASFKEQQDSIIDFITNNYQNYLPSGFSQPEYTTEYLDFDKFKSDFTIFIDFARIDFRSSEYDDDCGDIEHLLLTIYLARRNAPSVQLQTDILEASWSFYKMLKEDTTLGTAQETKIDSIDFYKYVEGNKYIVCSEISLSLEIEI
jgi:hypothetical protein